MGQTLLSEQQLCLRSAIKKIVGLDYYAWNVNTFILPLAICKGIIVKTYLFYSHKEA